MGSKLTVMRLYFCLVHPLFRASGKDKTMTRIPKTPNEFDYDLWTTEEGKCMAPKEEFDRMIARGIQPWAGAGVKTEELVEEAIAKGVKAGDLVKLVCTACGGSGGGKPDSAMGGGKDATKVDNALALVDDFVASKVN